MYAFCESLAQRLTDGEENTEILFTEIEESLESKQGDLAIGIDIGTTTISAVVIDLDNKTQVEVFSIPHNSYVESSLTSEQSVSVIMDKAERVLELIYKNYSNIVSIGVTGQMHGILYVNSKGEALSNLLNQYPPVLSVKQVAEILSVSLNTAYMLIRSKQIHSIRVVRSYRIPLDAVMKYLNNC
jgi:excisionase family DNA binding protein